ncbi:MULTISPECIES: hypothetical protein [unclassified Bradyrhizobium]|uniref:hypothetical protein n=1 Tax=unclassified Bradyrhizobium TaxID=2631580 RepID=UPI001FFB7058|nr:MULTISPECIES: hypothetical protein [unclassified Bradyrhizobium]MCK1521241.1 hypothetical protein [Bradyrhizobium sp. 17]MCK1684927.1 hypothetical protein [Bradyrhizobium sp. 145]
MALALKQLIASYRSDLDSPFQKLRYQVRIKQGRTFDRISEKYGHHQVRGITAPTLLYWYKVSGSGGRTAAANEMIARLRALFKFGFTLLEDPECRRLAEILRQSRFRTQGPRFVQLTAEHGLDILALPTSGPIIINDVTGLPWSTTEFRRKWRLVAKEAGVPDVVKNRDSVPTGTIVGGPDQAPVSQRITLARIGQSLRRGRR